MAKCKVCGVTDASLFYKSNVSYCKPHWKERVKSNRAANSDHYKEHDRKRANLPHRVLARDEYQKTDAFAVSHLKANTRYRELHPDRTTARYATNNAIRDGRLAKMPCFMCGCEQVEAHHADYSAPLDVVWLCVTHHKEVHKDMRMFGKAA